MSMTSEQTQDAGWRGLVAKASLALSIFTVFWFVAAALGTKLDKMGAFQGAFAEQYAVVGDNADRMTMNVR